MWCRLSEQVQHVGRWSLLLASLGESPYFMRKAEKMEAEADLEQLRAKVDKLVDDKKPQHEVKVSKKKIKIIKGKVNALRQKTKNNKNSIATAQSAADAAQLTANAAQNAADDAQTTADVAQITADAAQRTADDAMTTADDSLIFATRASCALEGDVNALHQDFENGIATAHNTADAAQSTADTAQSTADAAQSTADAAQNAADEALERGHTTAITANNAIEGSAHTLHTGSPCFLALSPTIWERVELRVGLGRLALTTLY
ncbi:uncharacterized protein [Watersipora subatra]|uniref:uncharacterized protein n=1 Tax=Watersipora subatra TaxID=2589382 RepID=UPI00355BD316